MSGAGPQPSAATARRAAALWHAGPDGVEPLSLGINAVYRAPAATTADGRPRILRLTRATLRRADELRAAAAWLEHLHGAGAPVPRPLRSCHGQLLEAVVEGERCWFVGALEALPGVPLSEPLAGDHARPAVMRAWGAALARLHAASADYRPPPWRAFHHWRAQWRRAGARLRDPALRRTHAELDGWLRSLPPSASTPTAFGLCHADARPGNLLWDGGRVRVIDFDEPTWHWHAYDLARAMLALTGRPLGERRALLDALLVGYRRVRPLAPRWQRELPRFLRLRLLLMLAWSEEDAERGTPIQAAGTDPAWAAGLRRQLLEPIPW